MIDRILGWFKRKLPAGQPTEVVAGYDAAQTTSKNRRLWADADDLSATAGNSAVVRRTLRRRARYETNNNSWALGIVLTLANDLIGTGPSLQVINSPHRRRIEEAFYEWYEAVDLPAKLRLMRIARAVDGEAFALLLPNPGLESRVKIDLVLIEADQVANPIGIDQANESDGIEHDAYGHPLRYRVLKQHPGDNTFTNHSLESQLVPARAVIHYFRRLRAGQTRGVPDLTPALTLFSELRRYSMAVLAAAETAADFAMVVQTNNPASVDPDEAPCMPFEQVDIDRRLATVLPEGYTIGQTKAEQPTTTHEAYQRTLLREIGRCLGMPYNVVAGDSSGHNFSSGKLDHLPYYKSLRVETRDVERTILSRLFKAWAMAAQHQDERLQGIDLENLQIAWVWDGHHAVDEGKSASAAAQRMRTGQSNLREEHAARGIDHDEWMLQTADDLGLEHEELVKLLIHATFGPGVPPELMGEPNDEADDSREPEEEPTEDDEEAAAAAALRRIVGKPLMRNGSIHRPLNGHGRKNGVPV